MREVMVQALTEIASSPKTASVVSALSLGSGAATLFEILPMLLGILATLAGTILSIVLIRTTLKRSNQETERHEAKMRFLNKSDIEG